jgi:hypothetical protein
MVYISDVTSVRVRSFPPVIFHTIPVALSIPISSRGDCIALSAASLARVLPANRPTGSEGGKWVDKTSCSAGGCRHQMLRNVNSPCLRLTTVDN